MILEACTACVEQSRATVYQNKMLRKILSGKAAMWNESIKWTGIVESACSMAWKAGERRMNRYQVPFTYVFPSENWEMGKIIMLRVLNLTRYFRSISKKHRITLLASYYVDRCGNGGGGSFN